VQKPLLRYVHAVEKKTVENKKRRGHGEWRSRRSEMKQEASMEAAAAEKGRCHGSCSCSLWKEGSPSPSPSPSPSLFESTVLGFILCGRF
jgi:hypothetical protein